jgi:hypothetical protein
MSDEPALLSEFLRVANETSKFKLFRRVLGFGSASRVVERSWRNDDASKESVALALSHKEQVSRARSEIRAAPLRIFAAIGGLADVLAFTVGQKTVQERITDHIVAKAQLRRNKSALKSEYSNQLQKSISDAINLLNQLNSTHDTDSPLSKKNILQSEMQDRLLRTRPRAAQLVIGDAQYHEAARYELQKQADAILRGRATLEPLTDPAIQYLHRNGLNPSNDPRQLLDRLNVLGRPVAGPGHRPTSRNLGSIVNNGRTNNMAYPQLRSQPTLNGLPPQNRGSNVYPQMQVSPMHHWQSAGNQVVFQPDLQPRMPNRHYMPQQSVPQLPPPRIEPAAAHVMPTVSLPYPTHNNMPLPNHANQSDPHMATTPYRVANGRQSNNAPIDYSSLNPQINAPMDRPRAPAHERQAVSGYPNRALPGQQRAYPNGSAQQRYDNRVPHDRTGRGRSG